MLFSILNRITRTARFTVVDGNHAGRTVNHPFIADLEAAAMVVFSNKFYKVGFRHNFGGTQ